MKKFVMVYILIYECLYSFHKIQSHEYLNFQDFWNWWELGCLALVYAIIILFIYRTVVNIGKMNDVHSNPNAFTNLHYAVLLDEVTI